MAFAAGGKAWWGGEHQAKGKGKEDKGKGKGKRLSPEGGKGHTLPRERLSAEKFLGTVAAWKGKYGWIKPAEEIPHEKADLHGGSLFASKDDLVEAEALEVGARVEFHIWVDESGLGAEEIVQTGPAPAPKGGGKAGSGWAKGGGSPPTQAWSGARGAEAGGGGAKGAGGPPLQVWSGVLGPPTWAASAPKGGKSWNGGGGGAKGPWSAAPQGKGCYKGCAKSWAPPATINHSKPVISSFDHSKASGKGYGKDFFEKGGGKDFKGGKDFQGGKGFKGGKKKGDGKGHLLPRTRVSQEKFMGSVSAWKGKYGWITPAEEIEHEKAQKHRGSIFVSKDDLTDGVQELAPGTMVEFHIWEDASGLGAEEVTVTQG